MKSILLIISLIIMTVHINAQDVKIIPLWTDSIPYAKEASVQEVDTLADFGGKIVYGITQPEMAFYKSNVNTEAPAVVICPGGGYGFEAYEHEGVEVAKWLNEKGIDAFVLKYRLPDERISTEPEYTPLIDAMQAIYLVKQNAKEYGIDPDKVGIMGFSAGGHLAASVSTLYHLNRFKEQDNCRPDFAALLYPVISMDNKLTHGGSKENLLGKNPSSKMVELFSCEKQVDKKTPPTFILHAKDDDLVPVKNTFVYSEALDKNRVPNQKIIFDNGGHGFGYRPGQETNRWLDILYKWLKSAKIVKE